MKKIVVLLFIIVCIHVPIKALNGKCMTKGPESPSSYNYEQWHFIECYHDCHDSMKFCIECGHHHAPKEKQIIVTQNTSSKKETTLASPVTRKEITAHLARKAKATKQANHKQ